MPHLNIAPGESLFFEHSEARDDRASFVFVNAFIAGRRVWDQVAPALAADGYGVLSYDFRGVGQSSGTTETVQDPALLVADLRRLADAHCPAPPVFVGLGFGGLIAAKALLAGQAAAGLCLINSLIEIGPRLDWLAAATPLIVGEGGHQLYMDALYPLLVGEEYLAKETAEASLSAEYAGIAGDNAELALLRAAAGMDWSVEFNKLAAPTLVISGLQDRVFLDREVVNRLFAELADGRAEAWRDVGHLLPAEQPEQLARSLSRFAQELAGASTSP